MMGIMVFLISCISIFGFIAAKKMLISVANQNISVILENSSNSRKIARFYSEIYLLTHLSLDQSVPVETKCYELQGSLKKILNNTNSGNLKRILLNISNDLNLFLDQYLKASTIFNDREMTHNNILKRLLKLEEYIGVLFVHDTLHGEDTKFAEQLLMLIIGYKESLFEIDKLFTKINFDNYSTDKKFDVSPVVELIDQLSLRFQTITASEPQVAIIAEQTIQEISIYKQLLLKYQKSFSALIDKKRNLETSHTKILAVMGTLDTNISKSSQNLIEKVVRTIFISTSVVYFLVISVIVALGFFIIKLFKSMEVEIMNRKLAQDDLLHSEARLQALSDASFESIFFSEKGTCLDQNLTAEKMFGYSRKEAIGKSGIDWITHEDRDTVIKNMMSGSALPYEVEALRKDGTTFPCEIQVRMIDDGNKIFRISALRDISNRRMIEKEKKEALIFAAEQKKLSLVGQVAGKMAHDFNNILGGIMGNAEIALMDCNEADIKKRLDLIFTLSIRGENLTKNLVAFAEDQELKQEFFQLGEKIDLVLNILEKDLERVKQVREYKAKIPDLLADPGMIEHLMVNLIQNSIHATSKVENPCVTIRAYHKSDYIYIEIVDNGCGIPGEHLKSVFDPAFTLKGGKDAKNLYEKGIKGTGYGLSNVKKYIDQHKGKIEIDSTLESGTKITVSLPVVKKVLTKKEKMELSVSINHRGRLILLVEDESSISDVQCHILSQAPCNHKVDIAPNGKVAIDMFNRKNYDLISLDYILPGGISGMDVYNHVRECNKKIPILFISGNIEFLESVKKLRQKDKRMSHLSKPCKNINYVNGINLLLENTTKEEGLSRIIS